MKRIINKPDCQLSGTDGNVYAIIGKVYGILKSEGFEEHAKDFQTRAFSSESYDKVLQLCFEYVLALKENVL